MARKIKGKWTWYTWRCFTSNSRSFFSFGVNEIKDKKSGKFDILVRSSILFNMKSVWKFLPTSKPKRNWGNLLDDYDLDNWESPQTRFWIFIFEHYKGVYSRLFFLVGSRGQGGESRLLSTWDRVNPEWETDPTEYRKQFTPLIDFIQYILSSNLFFNRLQSA